MDWISKIKTNDNHALSELYNQYRSDCLSWLIKKFDLELSDAIEVFQLSVIIVYDNVMQGKLTGLTGDMKSYLFGIAKNKALELRRHHKKFPLTLDFTFLVNHVSEDEAASVERESQIRQMSKCLDILGDPCKTVLELYYYNNKSMLQISETMGYKSIDSVKTQKYKCLKRLQKLYSDHILKSA